MPEITAIKPQKRNKDRFNVYLDGKYAFPVSLNVLGDFELTKGILLTDDQLNNILNEELFNKILMKTLDFISYTIRTQREIEDRLSDYLYKEIKVAKIREDFKQRILKKIEDMDLIDDATYVSSYIQSKSLSKVPPGRQKIVVFLLKKGIDKGLIDKYLEAYSYDVELSGAKISAEKKIGKLKEQDSYKLQNKLWKFLAGRGYSSDVIRAAVDSVTKF